MSLETTLGIIGAVFFIAGLIAYLKLKNIGAKLAGFIVVVAGVVLIAIAIVGLPA